MRSSPPRPRRPRRATSSSGFERSASAVAELKFPRVERPLVSIVVLTHNDIEWIPRALQACLDNTDACYELIVVDNGSTDGTAEFLTSETSGATVILNPRNYGFGAANNLGARHAVGQYLFF